MSAAAARAARSLTAVITNEGKLNFDKSLSFEKLAGVAKVTTFEDTDPEQVVERATAAGADILITKEMPVPGSVIELLPPSVRLICEAGTGYNNIDIAAAKRRGISVCNVPAYSTDAVATMVVTLMLSLSCSLVPQQRKVWEGDRTGWASLGSLPHFELAGKTIGLVGGRGTIGSRVTDIATAFGMRVLISSRSTEPSGRPNVEVVDLETLLRQSDFVSVHCPLNDHTRKLLGAKELRMMKPSSYLINTARGPIVDEAALAVVLKEGGIAGAGLDVHEVEPLPTDSPLFDLKNVILTPHIGWQRVETRQRLMDAVADNCAAFVSGSPVNVVNA